MQEKVRKWNEELYPIYREIARLPKEEQKMLSDKAFELLKEFPMYSKASGLNYTEAILIAIVLYGDKLGEEKV